MLRCLTLIVLYQEITSSQLMAHHREVWNRLEKEGLSDHNSGSFIMSMSRAGLYHMYFLEPKLWVSRSPKIFSKSKGQAMHDFVDIHAQIFISIAKKKTQTGKQNLCFIDNIMHYLLIFLTLNSSSAASSLISRSSKHIFLLRHDVHSLCFNRFVVTV